MAGNPLPHYVIENVPRDVWVVFPHELAELSEKELRRVLSPQTYKALLEDRASLLSSNK